MSNKLYLILNKQQYCKAVDVLIDFDIMAYIHEDAGMRNVGARFTSPSVGMDFYYGGQQPIGIKFDTQEHKELFKKQLKKKFGIRAFDSKDEMWETVDGDVKIV